MLPLGFPKDFRRKFVCVIVFPLHLLFLVLILAKVIGLKLIMLFLI
jgi:hypothetical protein